MLRCHICDVTAEHVPLSRPIVEYKEEAERMILGDNLVAGDIGESSINDFVSLRGLSAFLALTSDAVAGIDPDGHIIVSNDRLADLTGLAARQLIGVDIRSLLMLPDDVFATEGTWPFAFDGSEALLHCRRPNEGGIIPIVARAQRLGEQGNFLLVCRVADFGTGDEDLDRGTDVDGATITGILPGDDAEVVLGTASEAIQAAREVVGISQHELLQFLGTSTEDLAQELFAPIVDELKSVVDADIASIYLEDSGIYHLKGSSGELVGRHMPIYFEHVDLHQLESHTTQVASMVVFEPELAGAGKSGLVTIGDFDTGWTQETPASTVPPLSAYYVLPLRFGTDATALVIVGWVGAHALNDAEVRMLNALIRHLGTEVMNGLGTLRTRATDQVEQVMRGIRRRLEETPPQEGFDYADVFRQIAKAISGIYVPIQLGSGREGGTFLLADEAPRPFTLDLDEVFGDQTGSVRVTSARTSTVFHRWLADNGFEPKGALVDVDDLGGKRRTFMILRDWDVGPLESLDVNFLKRCLQDLYTIDRQRSVYVQADYISQSLQQGMEYRIQDVPGVTANALFTSATATASVGGDFYDILSLPGRRACIITGDVAGKGIQAASVASALRTALGAYAWEGLNPAQMVRLINDFFMGFSSLETFASLFVGIVDVEAGTLTYCSAGHPPALYLSAGNETMEFLSEQSGVVGAFREMVFTEATIPMGEGDTVLLYSDGVTEARNPQREFFGDDGLRETLFSLGGTPAEDLPQAIMDQLYEFTDNALNDDVTILTVRYDGPQEG